ncbi:MAG: 1,4-dihydroxy-6-naphthoate synthase [Bacteroidia bacterium]
MHIRLGFSTCPNDTFMFDAMVHGRIDTRSHTFEVHLADISQLNAWALAGALDMVKISYHTYGLIRDSYHLLDAGSALGYGCGPLLVARQPLTPAQLASGDLRVAIPGRNTTANLLLDFFVPSLQNKVEMIFHDIMPAVQRGDVDAGLIIHESRFTYPDYGLVMVQDLGTYWEQQTGLPIPLGAIVASKSLPQPVVEELDAIMHDSVVFAFAHPEESLPFVQAHAQELKPAVMQEHIKLYVNDFSLSLGTLGHAAVDTLLRTGEQMGAYSASSKPAPKS